MLGGDHEGGRCDNDLAREPTTLVLPFDHRIGDTFDEGAYVGFHHRMSHGQGVQEGKRTSRR